MIEVSERCLLYTCRVSELIAYRIVQLSVSKITYKRVHGFGCCVSTDVGTWTNWLTFEPDPDYGPDARTGLLSPISYKRCNAEFYVRKIPRTRIDGVVFGASSGFKMILFTELSDNFCRRYMRSTECPSSFINRLLFKEYLLKMQHTNCWTYTTCSQPIFTSVIVWHLMYMQFVLSLV